MLSMFLNNIQEISRRSDILGNVNASGTVDFKSYNYLKSS